jgi:hypothetical protein
MSNRPTYNTISNEQLLLINILNEMYNNNISQINSHIDAINGLNEANNNIRATLIQMLNVNGTRRTNTNPATTSSANNRSSTLDYYFPNSVTYLTNPLRRQNNINLESFFSPVEVYPTPTQVEAATRRVRYCDIVSPLNRSCPISLEEFNDNDMVSVIRQCGHIFKTDELNTWFRSNCRCPVCRYDIRNYRIRDTSNNIVQDISSNTLDSNTGLDNNINLDNSTDLDNSTNNLLTILFSNLLNSTDINST